MISVYWETLGLCTRPKTDRRTEGQNQESRWGRAEVGARRGTDGARGAVLSPCRDAGGLSSLRSDHNRRRLSKRYWDARLVEDAGVGSLEGFAPIGVCLIDGHGNYYG